MDAQTIPAIGGTSQTLAASRRSRYGCRRLFCLGPKLESETDSERECEHEVEFSLLDPEVEGILALLNPSACPEVIRQVRSILYG
jgi:hypothetical protein